MVIFKMTGLKYALLSVLLVSVVCVQALPRHLPDLKGSLAEELYDDGGPSAGFYRSARVPTDFSFNSDLALLRKMLSDSRPSSHRLLSFGK
ncbi:unnamed protein product [Dibothriocephalus latus]|uniref:Uncharacterized protein n=1 Tax=Dibothriocephalus latus TaxID=60516 RepID=A0A3P6P1N0_DIBLA|nr:unnamed protein product [Dibothriocephalus latus]